jgi:hypothetical protein
MNAVPVCGLARKEWRGCAKVKHWRNAAMALLWTGRGMLGSCALAWCRSGFHLGGLGRLSRLPVAAG